MSSAITIGTAPDSWGVWFPSDPEQVPPEVFLREVAEAGYEWIELGPYGYLPKDPAELQDRLEAHGLRVLAGTVSEHLHRPDSWDAVWSQVTDVAALTHAVGGKHIVVLAEVWRHHKTGEPVESRELTSEQWKQLADRPGRAGAEDPWRSTASACSSTPMPTAMSDISRKSSDFWSRPIPSGSTFALTPGTLPTTGVTASS